MMYSCCWKLLLLILFASKLHNCHGQTGTNAKDLYNYLFSTSGYNKHIRPVSDQSAELIIYLDLIITGILEVDDVGEKITTVGYMELSWTDDFLNWTPASYGNIQSMLVPQSNIWKPDVHLQNGFEDFKELGGDFMYARLQRDGSILWEPYKVFITKCSIDIEYFPFDKQTCSIDFVVWSSEISEVDLVMGSDGIILENFESNGEWKILKTEAVTKKGVKESVVSFIIYLERKPLVYLLEIVIPIILLSVLEILTFVLPVDSGEKISYSITVFLSFAVFLTIVSSSLPNNSDTVSYLSVYLIYQLALGVVVIILTVFQLRLHHRDPSRKVPKCLHGIIKFTLVLQCRVSIKRMKKKKTKENKIANNDYEMRNREELKTYAVRDSEKDYTWPDFVAATDFLFFWTLATFNLVTSLVIFNVAISSS